MRIRCCSFSELKKSIIEGRKKIIMFGAGVVGSISVPSILRNLGIISAVDCYVDNDASKWGKIVDIFEHRYKIASPDYLNNCNDNTVILLNISRFSDVLRQLESMHCNDFRECYIMPMMLIHNFCSSASCGSPVTSLNQLIPKKIHYMWLGGKEIPANLKKCIESWRRFCSDYEIIEWNENNYDIDKHPYMRQAYDTGFYGFVPDYARLDILYEHGGIYLDTDVEIRKTLDHMLCQEAFCGVEKWQVLNFGGCSGSVKGNPAIKKFIDRRKDTLFIDKSGDYNKKTCGFYDTLTAIDMGYQINGGTQALDNINIYAYDYFHPYDYMSGEVNITSNTYSIHWFNGGWLSDIEKESNETAKKQYYDIYKLAVRTR